MTNAVWSERQVQADRECLMPDRPPIGQPHHNPHYRPDAVPPSDRIVDVRTGDQIRIERLETRVAELERQVAMLLVLAEGTEP